MWRLSNEVKEYLESPQNFTHVMMLARTSDMIQKRLALGPFAQDADAALVRHEHNILNSIAKHLAIQNRRWLQSFLNFSFRHTASNFCHQHGSKGTSSSPMKTGWSMAQRGQLENLPFATCSAIVKIDFQIRGSCNHLVFGENMVF